MVYYKKYGSPVGLLYISAKAEGITGLWPEKDRYYPEGFKGKMICLDDDTQPNGDAECDNLQPSVNDADQAEALIYRAFDWLDRYFAGKCPDPAELPLAPEGSEFRQMVWEELLKIPYGGLTTYGDIGKTIASRRGKERMSAQAVGGAVGHNPISIIIPCHRVVGATGSLTGYGGGLDMKIHLLELEGIDMSKLYRPTKGTAL